MTGDRATMTISPGTPKPEGYDNIPSLGLLKQGQCRTADCLEHRHHMDKNSGYCRKCKISKGLLPPDKLVTDKRAVSLPVPEKKVEAVIKPTIPESFVDSSFHALRKLEPQRIANAVVDCWASLPLDVRLHIMTLALANVEKPAEFKINEGAKAYYPGGYMPPGTAQAKTPSQILRESKTSPSTAPVDTNHPCNCVGPFHLTECPLTIFDVPPSQSNNVCSCPGPLHSAGCTFPMPARKGYHDSDLLNGCVPSKESGVDDHSEVRQVKS